MVTLFLSLFYKEVSEYIPSDTAVVQLMESLRYKPECHGLGFL